jgi:tetratricopeptide (TPR) repeat protein
MKPEPPFYRRSGALSLAVLVFAASLFSPLAAQSDTSANLGNAKRMAANRHEIIMLLIKKKHYDQAAKEACKIFDMRWPDSQEPLLLTELITLSDQFLSHGQPSIALHLIEQNAKSFKQPESKIAILNEKGFIYKSLNQDDKALEFFRKAQELEKRR